MQLTREELSILDHIQVCLALQADFPFRSEEGSRQRETLLPASPCGETDSIFSELSSSKNHLPTSPPAYLKY